MDSCSTAKGGQTMIRTWAIQEATMPAHKHNERHHGRTLDAIHRHLMEVINERTVGKEDCETAITNLALFRREALTEPCACLIEPSIVIVVQGAKQMLIGDAAYA